MRKKLVPIFMGILCVFGLLQGLYQIATGQSEKSSRSKIVKPGKVSFLSQDRNDQYEIQNAIDLALDETSALYAQIYSIETDQILIDGNYAIAYINFYDPSTGNIVPTEPGLIIANKNNSVWTVTLPDDSNWNYLLLDLPKSLLSQDAISYYKIDTDLDSTEKLNEYGGYFLPWAGGITRKLTRSISHGGVSYYAFDFADTNDPMFEITASRPGVVAYVSWSYPNDYNDGNCNHANYIVIRNDLGLYDLYLHLAYNSISVRLRTVGSQVSSGEKLGNADNTGCSGGSHLHFQAHTGPGWYAQSIDITFVDVSVCGGRPRTPSEDPCSSTIYYTSGNYADSTPPVSSVSLSGSMGDNSWYLSTVAATISANDNLSGVAYSQYNLNGAGWVIYSSPVTIAPNGSNTFQYRSVDYKGNWEYEKSTTIKIDTEAPGNPVDLSSGCSSPNNQWQNECNNPNFSWSGANDSTSGLALYQYYWGGNAQGNSGTDTLFTTFDPSPVSDGAYYFRVRAKDNAGNWSSWTTLYELLYDATAPSGSILVKDGWDTTYQTLVYLNAQATDNASGLAYLRLRNIETSWSDWLPYEEITPWLLPSQSGQNYAVEIQYSDRAGNISPSYSDSIYLDIYPEQPSSTHYQIQKSTFSMGGTDSQSSNFKLYGTLSQTSATGFSQSDNFQLTSGYWDWFYEIVEQLKIYLPSILK